MPDRRDRPKSPSRNGGRRFLPTVAAFAALAFLSACGDGEDPAPAPPIELPTPAVEAPPLPVTPEPEPPPAPEPPATPQPDLLTPAPMSTPPAAMPEAVVPPAPPEPVPEAAPPQVPPPAPATPPPAPPGPAPAPAAFDDPELAGLVARADIAAGAALAAERCAACHSFGEGEANGIGPNLFGVAGARIGAASEYAYSPAMRALFDAGTTWTLDRLDAFLENPAAAVAGTRMGFTGVRETEERLDLLAYLWSLSRTPLPLTPARPDRDALTIGEGQVAAGAILYRAHCLVCHGESLRGVVDEREEALSEGPGLAGTVFVRRWFDGVVLDLYRAVATMPPAAPDTLGAEAYLNLLAYILSVNGFSAGATGLPADEALLGRMGFFQ